MNHADAAKKTWRRLSYFVCEFQETDCSDIATWERLDEKPEYLCNTHFKLTQEPKE